MTTRTGRRSERGSVSIEAAVLAPAFLLLTGLIIFGGRSAIAHQSVESAAAEAARSASLERTGTAAVQAARSAATASLANQSVQCRNVEVAVDDHGFDAPVGQSALVTVTVACDLDLSDLSVPGVPGVRTIRATTSSPLDTWRERS